MTGSAKQNAKPVLQAILLCDHVYMDKTTSKTVVAGIFTNINAAQVGKDERGRSLGFGKNAWLFLSFLGFPGNCNIRLQQVSLRDNQVHVKSPDFAHEVKDRLKPTSVAVEIPIILLPHFGRFGMEAYINDEYIGTAYFTVSDVSAKKEHGHE